MNDLIFDKDVGFAPLLGPQSCMLFERIGEVHNDLQEGQSVRSGNLGRCHVHGALGHSLDEEGQEYALRHSAFRGHVAIARNYTYASDFPLRLKEHGAAYPIEHGYAMSYWGSYFFVAGRANVEAELERSSKLVQLLVEHFDLQGIAELSIYEKDPNIQVHDGHRKTSLSCIFSEVVIPLGCYSKKLPVVLDWLLSRK